MNDPIEQLPVAGRADEQAEPLDASLPRVLLVDDDERNLLAVANVLDDLGEVVLARSGEEALRHLLRGEFAVILLDVYMPGMDGYETAQIIRKREQTKGIPIVFLSAVNKEPEHLMRGYSMGAVDYVFKPVDPLILKSKVGVFVDLYLARVQVEEASRANLQAELVKDDGQGEFAGTLTDVTEQRNLESRLLQAQKMDAIGQLTGGVAHDFNNLLSAVLGGLHLLERRVEFADREQLLITQMRHAAEQGAELVRRMMAFARKQDLTPASVDPNAL